MSRLPKRCLIDTNVPVNANRVTRANPIPPEELDCIASCIEAIDHIRKHGKLVIDSSGAILSEYWKYLSPSGQPGPGDLFMKWILDHYEEHIQVQVTPDDGSYLEFPQHEGLRDFDPADHKFIAVSNADRCKSSILQATDSQWWGYRGVLAEVGIRVRFLCPSYVRTKHERKMRRR